jgi:dihydrofolate reductase
MSLDGFIAGPGGEADWILMDPEIDFNAMYAQFDTIVMGRRSFEAMSGAGQGGSQPGMQVFVVSRTLRQADHPNVMVIDDPERERRLALGRRLIIPQLRRAGVGGHGGGGGDTCPSGGGRAADDAPG